MRCYRDKPLYCSSSLRKSSSLASARPPDMSSSSDRERNPDDFAGDEAQAKRPAHANPKPPTTHTTDTEPMAPHIPAPVLGHVLDYMPYEEVRLALLVGKIIAVEAVKYVQTINIMNGREMDVPAARRFADVTEVNILSLVRFHPPDDQYDYHFDLCETTAERTVPFIVGFQKLKRIRAGGIHPRGLEFHEYAFADLYLREDDAANNQGILRALVAHFIGALSTRLLPAELELRGITSSLKYVRPCRSGHPRGGASPNSCKHCSKILKYFPVKDLIKSHTYYDRFTCFDRLEALNMLADRQGFKERCREISEEYLVEFIDSSLSGFTIKDDDLCKRLQNMGSAASRMFYLDREGRKKVDQLIALGFDPKSVSHRRLHDEMNIGEKDRAFDVYSKSTFEFLVSRGFPFYEADLILLDEAKEPALKKQSREERNN